MSDDKPFALKYVESIENLWVSTLERAVNDKRLLGLPLRLMDLNFVAQKQLEKLGSKWLGLFGVPTAAQMRESLTMLQRVEELLQAQRAAGLAEASVPAPAPAPAPVSVPVPVSVPASVPDSASAPVSVPAAVPDSASAPVSAPASVPAPAPVSAPASVPDSVPAPVGTAVDAPVGTAVDAASSSAPAPRARRTGKRP